MAGSFLGNSGDFVTYIPRSEDSPLISITKNHRSLKVLMPMLLIMFAVFLAPERPQHFASICERHNPEMACRVF